MRFTGEGNGYKSFKECYKKELKDKVSKKDRNDFDQKVSDFFEKQGYAFLEGVENTFNCASVCSVPLFYITKDISEGRPQMECVQAVIEGVQGPLGIAAMTSIFIGFLLITAVFGTFPLCCSKGKRAENYMDKAAS